MQRAVEDGPWTILSRDDVTDLHHLQGQMFATRYAEHQARLGQGKTALFRLRPAKNPWRRMLTMLFETGHPWIMFEGPRIFGHRSDTWVSAIHRISARKSPQHE